MESLDGKVAVITGGGSGIGRATAELLAQRGCHLALVDIDAARLDAVASALRDAHPALRVSTHVADVAARDRMSALPAEVVAEHGAVHVVVNNAGVSVLKRFEDHTLEDLDWIIGINFWGVVHGCHFFLPVLREQPEETYIVNISSMFGFIGVPGQSSYCATKFAVRGFTESLWAELQGSRVGITSIHPGGIKTNIGHAVRATNEDARQRLLQNFEQYAHPPEDVARAVVKGIERKRLRVIVGREAYVFEWLKRLFPVRTHRWFAVRMDPAGTSEDARPAA